MRGGEIQLRPVPMVDAVFIKGGLGDTIARLPAIKYFLDEAPRIQKVRLFIIKYCVVIVKHLLKSYIDSGRLEVYDYDEMMRGLASEAYREQKIPGILTDSKHHTTLQTHLTDHAFHTLCDVEPILTAHKDYLQSRPEEIDLTKFTLPNKYIVITCGFTSPVREWMPEHVNDTVNWIKENGYEVVFLGKPENIFKETHTPSVSLFRAEIDYSQGVNLIDKTDVLEAAGIMNKAACVVGVDNGLIHVAATTKTPIVAGYTTVHPYYRLPYREGQKGHACFIVLPDADLECTFCQNQLHRKRLMEFDFRSCIYADYKCVTQLTSKKFKEAISECLSLVPSQKQD